MKNLILTLLISCTFSLYVVAQKTKNVQYLAEYTFNVKPGTKKINMSCLIPQHIDNIQHVDTLIYNIPPNRVYKQNGDRMVEFVIDSIEGNFVLEIYANLKVISNDSSNKKPQAISKNQSVYLVAEKYLESDQDAIIQQAALLKKNSELKTVQSIYNFVRKSLKYSGYNPKDVGALQALEAGHGDCTEFADLFVALCRASDIPAKVIEGYMIGYNVAMSKHNWAEVYIPELGWRVVDPTSTSFNRLENAYVKLTSNRTNPAIQNFHYYAYKYWGDPIEVLESIKTKVVD
ncbi:transglutaminase-like domain-containing protein [Sphingobacterium faecale]|uniref:Transglutaminase domain-containing protein n=1 Tax=Sphingobacterium faecale TaxID=2803775 RepID=A0ABS1QYX9_9SPHI|nr:transglutaminase-like domain-containing protein [Sphingobacterium faecale]MBL1407638.1 transglutaminase domain-containing protein [Sphingobacterium faecale]